ncbi:hypothetical protein JGU71_08615 [Antrihabitans sp. YC3-6]|uniref:DUF6286 domain-containing protein n=1 Tax=Antrihabitans stalagmiti TaxID=2799499 RepID=A0A934NPL8_9NOCA|nr:DUF6286 domain-containing protein [Antrihabitans stalagmiti]MBJ8338945.1 hypothetical protein [Antrihabitans stalagmiti]
MTSAKPPRSAPALRPAAIGAALALIAVGGVAIRDTLVEAGAVAGQPWIAPALGRLDGLSAQAWMVPAGIAVAVVGLLLLASALKPRRSTHTGLATDGLWIRRHDLLEFVRRTASDVSGVEKVEVRGSFRKVVIKGRVLSDVDKAAVGAATEAALGRELAVLSKRPKLAIAFSEAAR